MPDADQKRIWHLSYRTKLFVIFLSFAVVSNGLLFAVLFSQANTFLFKELQSKVLSVAATAAALVDGDKHAVLHSRDDEKKPEYLELAEQFRKMRDANRRADINIANVYTMFITPDRLTIYGVDAEENEAEKGHFGDVYRELTKNIEEEFDPAKLQVTNNIVVDQWGEWISATAPLKDGSGKVVAAVGVDIAADEIVKRSHRLLMGGLLSLAVSLTLAAGAAWILSRHATGPLYAIKTAVEEIGRGNLDARAACNLNDEFGEVAKAIDGMARGLKERDTVKSAFSRYVSHQLMDHIFAGENVSMKGDRRKVTVLFTDLVGFTSMAELLPPEEVVTILNEYFKQMIDIIFRHDGTLDKFLGDGMMVLFGAPLDDQHQEEHAIKAAIEMQEALKILSAKLEQSINVTLRMGIGINTGIAVVGNIGSDRRMEYTAIGDTVNIASRLQSATRTHAAGIIISDYTYVAIRHMAVTRSLGSIEVKGRAEAVNVYALEGLK